MNVITISRECHAGAGEVSHRLAEVLGWERLDRELLHQAAALEAITESEVSVFDERPTDPIDNIIDHQAHERHQQGLWAAIRRAAARGNVILVGRGARHVLGYASNYLHVRLVAPLAWRVRRTARRHGCGEEEAAAICAELDQAREQFRRQVFGRHAADPSQYDLILNTARVPLGDVVDGVAALVRGAWPPDPEATGPRVLTLSRELGAAPAALIDGLAERLRLRPYDRQLLELEASRLGVTVPALEAIDERPPGLWQRLVPGSRYQRYRRDLEQVLRERADGGDALLVGRGANRVLGDRPEAFHVRFTASPEQRLVGLMYERGITEEAARRQIAHSDEDRRRFYASNFGADWSDPHEYHLTVNTSRLAATAVDLIAFFAARHWARQPSAARTPGSRVPAAAG